MMAGVPPDTTTGTVRTSGTTRVLTKTGVIRAGGVLYGMDRNAAEC